MTTESLVGLLLRIIPDFETERYERRKIRTKCKEIKRSITDTGNVRLINSQDRKLEYLPDTAETHCVDADSLLRENGTEPKDGHVRIVPEDSEEKIKAKLDQAIEEINHSIYKNIIAQIIFTVSVLIVVGIFISIGLLGITQIGSLIG